MKNLLTIILLTSSMSVFGQTTFSYNDDFKKILARTKDANDNLSYDKLLKRFAVNDTTLTNFEVLALLIGFTGKPDYRPYQDLDIERNIYGYNGDEKYQRALDSATKFLSTHPLSEKALFEKSYSFYKLGQQDSASFYMYKGRRIFYAMNFSGNGKSAETPTFALGPADGQDYIKKYIDNKIGGAKIGTMGSGSDKNGYFLDILEVVPEDGKTAFKLYFIIQHAIDKMYDGKSIEEELKRQNKTK